MIVVDTHILIWGALQPEKLSINAKETLFFAKQTNGLAIAGISLWEISMLLHKKRLEVDTEAVSFLNLLIQANQLTVQPITPAIAALSTQLPSEINHDPADRLIVATAVFLNAPLLTADRNLRAANVVETIW